MTTASIARRHDLDALRAIAMLLGIVLHAAMSFIPGIGMFWAVEDPQAHAGFGLLLGSIHGFRMPLFFLISGFFTAMLWRKRGLQALLWHRFLRIFLPLVLGMFTIIPATWILSAYVKAQPKAAAEKSEAVKPQNASAALMGAASFNNAAELKRLIEGGADVNFQDERGSTPLHAAAFFGRAEAAEVLLESGADPEIRNQDGARPLEAMGASWEITKWFAGTLQIPVEEKEVMSGRRKIAAMLGASIPEPKAPGLEALFGLLMLLFYGPLFGHLWFLWFLCWLVVGFAVCVAVGKGVGFRGPPRGLSLSFWRYAWLLPLTAILQMFMGQSADGFGPDTSIGLLPLPHVLIYYAIFFGFGALYYEADDREGRVGKYWMLALPTAFFVLFPLGMWARPSGEHANQAIWVFSQVAYVWLASFGAMGMFRWLFSRESPTMRYLSDSSYWLYLAHIPLVIYLQYAVRDWGAPAWVKCSVVCLVAGGVLLLSYQLLVRHTPIGWLLNGRKKKQPAVAASSFPAETL